MTKKNAQIATHVTRFMVIVERMEARSVNNVGTRMLRNATGVQMNARNNGLALSSTSRPRDRRPQ